MPVSSPIAQQTVEDAIYDWFNGATGLTTIWKDQDAPQPAYPYAALKIISGPVRFGTLDEVRQSYDAGEAAGQEIGLETGGPREITVSCQIYALRASVTPSTSPRDYMTRAQSALGMWTYLTALRAGGLAVVEILPVQDVSERVEDTWGARAVMDVRFRLAASVTERTGYIATTEVDPTYKRPDNSAVDPQLDAPFTVP
jgi:hypothetical protein